MNRAVLLGACLALAVAAVGPEGAAAPDDEEGRGWIDGEVLRDGAPAPARVEVRLFHPNPRHPHGFPWTAEHTLRFLRPPAEESAVRGVVSADDAGRFAVRDLSPGRYQVRATDADGHWGSVLVPLDADGQHQHVTLVLREAGARLEGTVRHADGRPFDGFVLANREAPRWGDSSLTAPMHRTWTRTDDEGRFVLEDLLRGEVRVTALVPGHYRRTLRTVEVPFEGELDLVVDAVGRPTVGRVLDTETEAPIEGVQVVWMGHYDGRGPCCGVETTAEDGSYVLLAPRGVYKFHARKAGYAEGFRKDLRGVGEGVYRLRRGSHVEGRVVEAQSRKPVPGLLVERRGPGSYWYQWTRAETDGEGRFRLPDQAPGWGRIFARAHGWIPRRLEPRRLLGDHDVKERIDPLSWYVAPGQSIELELEVVRGATLTGRVVDHEGRPVAGVPLVEEAHDDPAYSWTGHEVPAEVATGPDGSFWIGGLLFGEHYEFQARPTGGAPASARFRMPPEPGAKKHVEIRLPAPHWLLVRVVAADTRKPIAGAEVSLMLKSRDERVWFSGQDGVAKVGPIGAHQGTLDVRARGFVDANQRGAPKATREGARVTVALARALEIRGVVKTPDGSPAGDAIVYTSNVGDSPVSWDHYRGKDRCRRDGSFVVGRVKAIEYEVKAVLWRDEARLEAKTVVRGGAHDVALVLAPAPKPKADPPPTAGPTEERPVVLVVRVVDGQGRPVPRALLNVPHKPREVEGGRIELTEPWPEKRPVRVWNARADDGIRLPLGPVTLERAPCATGTFMVTLPPEMTIEGRVVDPDGSPVARVQVEATPVQFGITPPPIPLLEPESSFGVTDPAGRFRIGGLGAEECVLRLTLPEGWLAPVNVLRARPDGEPVEIRLRRTATVEVEVTGPDGAPLPHAFVRAWCDGWSYFWRHGWSWGELIVGQGHTDAAGRCVVGGIDPLRAHAIRAAAPGGRKDLAVAEVEIVRPEPVSIRLGPQGTLAGRIVTADGEPVEAPCILVWRQEGAWQWSPVWAQAGAFEKRVEAAGTIEVAVGLGVMRAPHSTTKVKETAVGATGLELVLDPGATLPVRFENWAGEEDQGWSFELRREGDERGAWSYVSIRGSSGSVSGVDPAGTYSVWCVRAPGGLCARVEGVRATGEEVVIPLEPGLSIRGALFLGDGGGWLEVHARPVGGGPWVPGTLEDGTYVLEGLTPGRWRVRASAVVGSWPVSAEGEVEAGDTLDLELRPAGTRRSPAKGRLEED